MPLQGSVEELLGPVMWREEYLPASDQVLRTPIGDEPSEVFGPVAKRMTAAVRPHVGHFITPMAAVAGAVADEICVAMSTVDEVRKIYVNDGGDIAFHLDTGESLAVGLVPVLVDAQLGGSIEISSDMSVRGIATSGMDGRSFSFGIADAVTVLASSAASADAAATLIANAVVADHPAIERVPASLLDPDSDLGDRLVTVERACKQTIRAGVSDPLMLPLKPSYDR